MVVSLSAFQPSTVLFTRACRPQQELQGSSCFGNYGITENSVTKKTTKNVVASSSHHPHRNHPASAANRSVRGYWEADTLVNKQGKACLVTLVDPKSRYLLDGKAMRKTAIAVSKVMCEALSRQPHLSVTPDGRKEFLKHAQLRKELTRVTFHFPAPHHPWECGANENTNGLLQEFFPKDKNITNTPEDYI